MLRVRKVLLSVIVFLYSTVFAYAKTDKSVYLTVDDGPLGGVENLMSVVDKYRIPVTFFLVGEHVDAMQNNKILFDKIMKNSYITIGNHSYSHAHSHYQHFYQN